jgi:hypothetical protein
MRLVFLVLLVANLAVAAYLWLGTDHAPPAPPANELVPERIKLIDPDNAKKKSAKGAPRACLEWGAFTVTDAARAAKAVDAFQPGLQYTERRVEGTVSYWVHIPPQPTRRAAEALLAGVKRIGGDEYYVVQDDGRYANAISLGLFNNEAGALARREALTKLGVRDVAVATRESTAVRIYLRFRAVSDQAFARLGTLRTEFVGSDLRECSVESAKG